MRHCWELGLTTFYEVEKQQSRRDGERRTGRDASLIDTYLKQMTGCGI
jgi:hypothetical protein